MNRVRLRAAAHAGNAVGALSRALGRGAGSVISGRVIETFVPHALRDVLAGRPVAVVSGTNGKSTTTALLRAALATRGPVAANDKGANMPAGIVAALAGVEPGIPAVIEVDEGYVPRVLAAAPVSVVVLLNLSRDQLDRVAEVRKTATRWRDALAQSAACVVANADDPCVVFAARDARRVVWIAAGSNWRVDAASCPNCGARIEYADPAGSPAEVQWRCEGCELSRPRADWSLDQTAIELRVPGRHNQHNALMALAAALELGVDQQSALAAMKLVGDVEGRYLAIWGEPSEARLLLSKNPAGWIEILNLLDASPRDALIAINANVADGKDTSWLWDVPFERLRCKRVIATGARAHDLAVRLVYADVSTEVVTDLRAALSVAQARDCDVIANYTAFRDIRKVLAR